MGSFPPPDGHEPPPAIESTPEPPITLALAPSTGTAPRVATPATVLGSDLFLSESEAETAASLPFEAGTPGAVPGGGATGGPLALLTGTLTGPDTAQILSRGGLSSGAGGTDGLPDFLPGTETDPSPARLRFLLDPGARGLFPAPDAPGDSTAQRRDTAELLPLKERALALAATLFAQKGTPPTGSESAPAPAGAARETESVPPAARPNAALLDFVAGVKPAFSPARPGTSAPVSSWRDLVRRYLQAGGDALSALNNALHGRGTGAALPGVGRTGEEPVPQAVVPGQQPVPAVPPNAGAWSRGSALFLFAAGSWLGRDNGTRRERANKGDRAGSEED